MKKECECGGPIETRKGNVPMCKRCARLQNERADYRDTAGTRLWLRVCSVVGYPGGWKG